MRYVGAVVAKPGVDVVFVWTDELAEVVAACEENLADGARLQLESWRERPSAYRVAADVDVVAFAHELLGLPQDETKLDDVVCPCGLLPASLAG